MKGIILAGGSGSRLYPLTLVTSKQLLPVYDKPMIYYPLSTLMLAGIRDILIISTMEDTPKFEKLLGNGEKFGIKLTYLIQPSPDGLAQAFILGKEFIGNDSVCLILGDNIFYGNGLSALLTEAVRETYKGNSTVFGYYVENPERYGVVELDLNGNPISIEEKPGKAKSNYAVTGIYFYDNKVIDHVTKLIPSKRGELEITDLNNIYLLKKSLKVITFGRGFTWLDTGTHESLAEATLFVKMIEDHQGLKISCPEEIAFKNEWISKKQLEAQANLMKNNQYGQHLINILNGRVRY